MPGGLRKALGSLKDTTTVSLARINGGYKELDIAIVKATNHSQRPPSEKYIRVIISAVSATRPQADVKYCIHALARRLSKTHNWAVALKALIVIHRALRDVDPTFYEELILYGKTRRDMLNMARFKDASSPEAWDYSAWIRAYALFLEEKLECFSLLKYDVEMDLTRTKELDVADLLEQLPILQQLLYRVLCCEPCGTAVNNNVIQVAFSMVASESMKIYEAICDGVVNLVDKFFELKRHDAVRALEIYRRSVQQAEKLSEFYENLKNLDVCRGETFIKVDQPPASFLHAMEDYVKEAPRMSGFQKDQAIDNKKQVLAIEYRKSPDKEEASPASHSQKSETKPTKVETSVAEPPPDLMSLDYPVPSASGLEEKNVLPSSSFHAMDQATSVAPVQTRGTTSWELALVTEPSPSANATATKNLGSGLDKLTLDSLYDEAIKRNNQNVNYSLWQPSPVAVPMMQPTPNNPFYTSHGMGTPQYMMSPVANQQQVSFFQQQQMIINQQPQRPSNPFGNLYGSIPQQQQQRSNPFGDSYGVGVHLYNANMQVQAHNPNT